MSARISVALCVALCGAAGCCTTRPTPRATTQAIFEAGLQEPFRIEELDADVAPPRGWVRKPILTEPDNTHQVFESPSGDTAYGVIHFRLPLPVGASLVYPSYISNMKEREGEANVVAGPDKDPALPGVRFTVESGDYRMRTNLICKGFGGWSVYAGTRRSRAVNVRELEVAERARDATVAGNR